MADDELGAWDDEDYTPPAAVVKDEYGQEVVRKLGDEEEKKPEPPAPSKPKEKAKKLQPKGKQDPDQQVIDTKKLTPQELEELQRASDLAAAAEIFGTSISSTEEGGGGAGGSIDQCRPQSKEDFEALGKLISSKLGSYHKSEHYVEFLSKLFTDLCLKLDSKHILHFGKELTALASQKLKEEKEREKQKQPKAKKKPTLIGGAKGGELDDILGGGAATRDFNDYDDGGDDFM